MITSKVYPLNILQIVRGLDIGGDSGGAEKFGVELARALSRLGHEVTICAFFRVHTPMEEDWGARLADEGIRVFFLADWGGYGNASRFVLAMQSLWRQLKDTPPFDVVQSHFQLGTLTALLLKMTGRAKTAYRTSHIRHEWEKGKHTWWLNRIFIQYLFPMLLEAEVGVSQAIVDYLAGHPGVKLSGHSPRLIHNAVSFVRPPVDPLRVGVFPKAPEIKIIGSVGRLETQKGYNYLLDAVPKVISDFPGARFYVIGEGSLHQELEDKAITLGISEYIHFMGIRPDVPYLLQELDLFVLPSLWEGFPTVIMESMICNVPVIATNIPGTSELIQTECNGWLVPAENPAALADVVLVALKNPARSLAYAAQAAEDVKKFTIEIIAEEYYRLYISGLFPKQAN